MSLEQELRDTLRQAADELGPARPAAGVRSEGMRALARRRSRRRVAVLGAGLAVLVIGVGIPTGLSLIESADNSVAGPGERPEPTPESTAEPTTSVDIFGGPTRGSLAGDADFVEAIRRMPWPEPDGAETPATPPVETRHVVYVGDFVIGSEAFGTAALVVGMISAGPTGSASPTSPVETSDSLPVETSDPRPRPDPPDSGPPGAPTSQDPPEHEEGDRLIAAWVTGPAGASIAELDMGLPRWISADRPTSIYDGFTGSLLVVSAPGDMIEISARPEVAADATINREYVDSGASDGFAVSTVPPSEFSGPPSIEYRVSRAGTVIAEQRPDEIIMAGEPDLPDIYLEYLREPDYSELGDIPNQEVQFAADILAEYGMHEGDLVLQVHYIGPIPSQPDTTATMFLLTATFPSGAVLTRAEWIESELVNGGYTTDFGRCADQLSPAGTPAEERSMALRCDVGAGVDNGLGAPESTLIVVAPDVFFGGYAVAEGGSAGADVIPVSLDEEGVGMIAFPESVRTIAIYSAADGAVFDRVPIFTS